MKFFTSDLHFGHTNIIKFCDRPFANADQMDHELIKGWNARVTDNDEVVIVGDIFMRGSFGYMKSIVSDLKGKISLVPGNHDTGKLNRLSDLGIKILPLIHEVKHNDTLFVCCHYPMDSWNKSFHGSIQLHGHIHGKAQVTKHNRVDVGWDAWRRPITGDEIMSALNIHNTRFEANKN